MRSAQFEVLPQQADQIETEALFSAAYGGVGSGKTFGAQWKMWKRLRQYPLAGHYVVGADFEQLRGGYFIDFRNMLEDLMNWKEGIDFRMRDSPRPTIILLDSGARVRALSSELAERIRSTQIQSLHAEEPQTWNKGEQVWQTLVGRMRHSTRSAREYPDMPIQAWMTFNPGGNPGAPMGSWLHKLVTEKWAGKYPSWRFDLEDNYLLQGRDQYIENIRTNYPPHLWPVEINGHWPTAGGDVYRGFDASVHGGHVVWQDRPEEWNALPKLELDPTRALMLHCDFNIGHMAWVISQLHEQDEETIGWEPPGLGLPPEPVTRLKVPGWQRFILTVLDEIALENKTVSDALKVFLNRYGDWLRANDVTVRLYGDSTGGNRNQQTIVSNWEVIMHGLNDAGIAWDAWIPDNPAEWDRVNEQNAQFQTGEGYGLLVDISKCPELVTDWRMVPKKEHENKIDKLKFPERTHWSDALGYGVVVERRLMRREPVNRLNFMDR